LAYQTIFAKYSGAVAAPTASLHFSEEMLEALKAKGVYVAEVTLHVGPGTFQNISVEDFTQHKMHGEHYELTKENAEIINKAKREGGRIVTVGTTSTRVVETIADANGIVKAQSGVTHAFFYPGYRYKIVDGLLTNFHWPKSSLILLVSAFYGNEKDAREFLAAIQGMSPVQITETVKRWVADGRISELSKNRALWRVLHDNGLYPRTEPNWNSRIK